MTVLIVCLILAVFCIAMLIKNELTCKIQIGWVNDVYHNKVNGDDTLDYSDIPSYTSTLFNPLVWKYKPLDDVLSKPKKELETKETQKIIA